MIKSLIMFSAFMGIVSCFNGGTLHNTEKAHKQDAAASSQSTSTDVGNGHDLDGETIEGEYNNGRPPLSLACGWNTKPTSFSCYGSLAGNSSPSLDQFDVDIVRQDETPLDPSSYKREQMIVGKDVLTTIIFLDQLDTWKIKVSAADQSSVTWKAVLDASVVSNDKVQPTTEKKTVYLDSKKQPSVDFKYTLSILGNNTIDIGTDMIVKVVSLEVLASSGFANCAESCVMPPDSVPSEIFKTTFIESDRLVTLDLHSLKYGEKFRVWVAGSAPTGTCVIDASWEASTAVPQEKPYLIDWNPPDCALKKQPL